MEAFREHKIDFVRHEVSVYLVLKYINYSKTTCLPRQVSPSLSLALSSLLVSSQAPHFQNWKVSSDTGTSGGEASIYRDLRKWFLSVGPGPGRRAGVQGCTCTENGMIIVYIRSTNRQIKSVNIFYIRNAFFFLG